MFYKIPDLIIYNSGYPDPYTHALPHTIVSAAVVWVGFTFHKIKNTGIRFFLVLCTIFSTYLFLGNLFIFLGYYIR